MRASGILLPIASLPSKYGIGSFSKSAYDFVDMLKEAGQKYWQILPLGPTGYGDSPYQSFSTFAGNPYFIDLDTFVQNGWLTEDECAAYDFGNDARHINYEKIHQSRFKILRLAYERSSVIDTLEFISYQKHNAYWLNDYCLYMAVKNYFNDISWILWEKDIRLRESEALRHYEGELADEILFQSFLQFEFWQQWKKLKKYANHRGIEIIGDIPIYVAFDSTDSWAHPELFQFNEDREPFAVAGCPPDGFSADGQLWGNPLYDWDYHKKTGYTWWTQRIIYSFELYDILRVDHFRAFDEYYSIPFGAKTAVNGTWKPGPGWDIFEAFNKKLGKLNIIAEDLGYLTPSVLKLVDRTGYPGMKVLEFAFDSREESDYLPHNYQQNCVVYTGTHDNQTIQGWFETLNHNDKDFAIEYMNLYGRNGKDIHWEFIRLALASVADLAIIPMQDYLGLDDRGRINTPSTLGGNWTFRLLEGEITGELIGKIYKMTKLYGRSA